MIHLQLPNGEQFIATSFTTGTKAYYRTDGLLIFDIKQYWEMVKPRVIR